MEFFQEVLVNVLAKENVQVTFPNIKMNATEIVEMECFYALTEIKAIIENDSLDDFECVESIVCVLERLGSGGGNRHDFG